MVEQVKDGLTPVGVIAAARGLKGDLRVKTYTDDPKSIGSFSRLTDATGNQTFKLKVIGEQKGMMLVRIQGVNDRDAADALKGQMLYIEQEILPTLDEDEFYFSDLVGLNASLIDGSSFGLVVEAQDFGAGSFLEIETEDHGRVLVPFTKANMPTVDIKGGTLIIDLPEGLLDPGVPEPQGEGGE